MFLDLRGQERTWPYDWGGEKGLAVVYLICKRAASL